MAADEVSDEAVSAEDMVADEDTDMEEVSGGAVLTQPRADGMEDHLMEFPTR